MNNHSPTRQIVVGVSGASGARYAQKLIQGLVQTDCQVHLVISTWGKRLFADELNISPVAVQAILGRESDRVTLYSYNDVGAQIASGSFRTDGMVICPCSSHTLGAIASGLGENLLHRAAQVTLKETRRLILVYREMPMSQIDIRNALTLSQAGAVICPANPGYYMLPQSVDDLVNFVVGKILDLLNIDHSLNTRWQPDSQPNLIEPIT